MNPNLMPLYRFWVQVAITFLILIFCGFNLSNPGKGRANNPLYSNLVFFIIGFWLPSPGGQTRKEGQVIENSEQTNLYIDKSKQ